MAVAKIGASNHRACRHFFPLFLSAFGETTTFRPRPFRLLPADKTIAFSNQTLVLRSFRQKPL